MGHLSNPEEKDSSNQKRSKDSSDSEKTSQAADKESHSELHVSHEISPEQKRRSSDLLDGYNKKKRSSLFLLGGALLFVIVLIIILVAISASVTKKPVYYYSLQGSLSGWTTKGSPPGIITSVAGPPKDGKTTKCLRYVYKATAGGFTGVVKMMPDLKGLTSVDFWIWSGLDSEFVIGLEEDDGSSYIYLFNAPKEKWTHIEATPERFLLNEDSQDENGWFDTDRLSSPLFIADVSGLRGKEYDNTIYLADLTIKRTVPKTVIKMRSWNQKQETSTP
ncbi:MAG: hypothetical protein AB9903_23285 [Vulcanimicrobiota bacterium]